MGMEKDTRRVACAIHFMLDIIDGHRGKLGLVDGLKEHSTITISPLHFTVAVDHPMKPEDSR